MIYFFAKLYVFLYGYVQDWLGIRLRGLGYVLRLNRNDRVFTIRGQSMFFDHRVAAAYGRLVAGSWNEPETHRFLDAVLAGQTGPIAFIDVGASIGEFVIDVARRDNVTRVVAFEPLEECSEAIRRSAALNGWSKVEVLTKLVNETGLPGMLSFDARSPTASAATRQKGEFREINATTLDRELGELDGKVVLLIDVEGAEPGVLKGGRELVRRCAPLIIFEYNSTSKKYFNLSDMRTVLGEEYTIYRLNPSGTLDLDFDRSWNCVAVSAASPYMPLCDRLFRPAGVAVRDA